MSIITRTVTINAAFLQEIKEDNQRLREIFCMLRDKETPWRLTVRELAELVAQLRDQLATHFALEEAFGYFEHPVRVAPHLGEKAEELISEHESLYAAACELAETGDRYSRHSGEHHARQMWSQFKEFDAMFQRHESRENELIMQAFTDDLGVGD